MAAGEGRGDGGDAEAGAGAEQRARIAGDNHAPVRVAEPADGEGDGDGHQERAGQEEPRGEEFAEGGLPDRDWPRQEELDGALAAFFGPETGAGGGSEERPEPRMVEEETIQAGDAGFVEPADEERQGHRERVEHREEDVGQRRAEVAGELAADHGRERLESG